MIHHKLNLIFTVQQYIFSFYTDYKTCMTALYKWEMPEIVWGILCCLLFGDAASCIATRRVNNLLKKVKFHYSNNSFFEVSTFCTTFS